MKKLVIIGNADVASDHSELVNSFDAVVRINLRKNHNTIHGTTGTKTDLLCYTPRAVSLVMNNEEDLKVTEEYCGSVSRLWFLRPRHAYWVNRVFLAGFLFRKERLFFDLSRAFIKRFTLKDCKIEFVKTDFLNSIILNLQNINPGGQKPSPSAGIMAIEKLLADKEFAHFEKYLLGFTFEGWAGHPWESEKKLVNRHMSKGLLSFIHEK
jgi:hypothetical protein